MSVLKDVFEGIKQTMILSERVDRALKLAEATDERSRMNSERLTRVETIIDFGIRQGGGSPPRLEN